MEGLVAQPEEVPYREVFEVEDHGRVGFVEAAVLGEEPTCSCDVEEFAVFLQPAVDLPYLVPGRYCVDDYREFWV